MPLSATEVRHLYALTALDEGRSVADDDLRMLLDAGLAESNAPLALTLEGRVQLRNLLSRLRGQFERGMDGVAEA
jgi:hypothetical protein